ncbi:glycosyltransferase family 2 protein, partial [Flavobacteriaceae bacterium]|nr:glycosyltransferase family 2 protein [Flavobacteriaceae bacterium]
MTRLEGSIPFEVVVVDDGSSSRSDVIIHEFPEINIHYYYKENTGPGDSRNFGMKRANGNYFIILDSDCILSSDY